MTFFFFKKARSADRNVKYKNVKYREILSDPDSLHVEMENVL